MLVLDTNVVSETMRARPEASVLRYLDALPPSQVYLTTITVAEIRYGVARLPKGRRREQLSAAVATLFAEDFRGRVLPFDIGAADEYGAICAAREATGRPISTADAMIAAICRLHDATLVTRNTADFTGLGLSLFDPWGSDG